MFDFPLKYCNTPRQGMDVRAVCRDAFLARRWGIKSLSFCPAAKKNGMLFSVFFRDSGSKRMAGFVAKKRGRQT
jgi:hypothetical protein